MLAHRAHVVDERLIRRKTPHQMTSLVIAFSKWSMVPRWISIVMPSTVVYARHLPELELRRSDPIRSVSQYDILFRFREQSYTATAFKERGQRGVQGGFGRQKRHGGQRERRKSNRSSKPFGGRNQLVGSSEDSYPVRWIT